MRRLLAVVASIGALAAACGNGGDDDASDSADTSSTSEDPPADVDAGDAPSALADPDHPDLPEPLIDTNEIISGGPPPDGIPPIDAPTFEPAGEVDWLQPQEPVIALSLEGAHRAYPVQVLTWHEIVNDEVAGVPVSVTYCPLCNSAIAFDRRVGDQVVDFGTSGKLYQSALVMYDRQTESLWTHYTGEAVAGALTGTELETFPVSTVSWAAFLEAHPDGEVLSRDTGFPRNYGQNPYPGYDSVDSPAFLFRGEADDRLAAKTRVVGIQLDGDAAEGAAVDLELLMEHGVVEFDAPDGRRLSTWWVPGTASALDAHRVGQGKDVGATGVFDTAVDGETLSFERSEAGMRDTATDSLWNIFGEAVEGPMAGTTLDAVPHVDTFWFAWAAYQPDTLIVSTRVES